MNEQDILKNAGKISAEIAKQIAESEYDKFDAERRTIEAERADEEIRRAVKRLVEGKGGLNESDE